MGGLSVLSGAGSRAIKFLSVIDNGLCTAVLPVYCAGRLPSGLAKARLDHIMKSWRRLVGVRTGSWAMVSCGNRALRRTLGVRRVLRTHIASCAGEGRAGVYGKKAAVIISPEPRLLSLLLVPPSASPCLSYEGDCRC